MLLYIYVLLLALGVSGHQEDSSRDAECDINSQLVTKHMLRGSNADVNPLVEWRIGKFDPTFQSPKVQLIGSTYIDNLPQLGLWVLDIATGQNVADAGRSSGTWSKYPLTSETMTLSQDDGKPTLPSLDSLADRSYILVLSPYAPAQGITWIDLTVASIGASIVYDYVAVALPGDEQAMQTAVTRLLSLGISGDQGQREYLRGATLKDTGARPQLAFRSGSVGDWYVVNVLGDGPIFDANTATEVLAEDFSWNPLELSANVNSITNFPSPNYEVGVARWLISEVVPSQNSLEVEIVAPGDTPLYGCLWVTSKSGLVAARDGVFEIGLDSNAPLRTVVRSVSVSAMPSSFIVGLSSGCPDEGAGGTIDDLRPHNLFKLGDIIHDAVGVTNLQADYGAMQSRMTFLLEATPWGQRRTFTRGTVLPFTGAAPQLVFRESSVGDLYMVDVLGVGPIFSANENSVQPGDFDGPNPLVPTLSAINPSYEGGVIGDPHIHTFAGEHYTLLRQGSFLLWQFALRDVQWKLYAHYGGHQSFTKGLLLVDTSGPQPSTMEITSEECQWQTKSTSTEWSSVTSDNQVVMPSPSSHMKLAGHQHKDMTKIELFLADEKNPVAKLKVLCRKRRHINIKLHMNQNNQKWGPAIVSGELKGRKDKTATFKKVNMRNISTLQLAAKDDQEFEVNESWKELGGSSHAQQYLYNADEHSDHPLAFLQKCRGEEDAHARALCQKHLGEDSALNSAYLQECIFDVCNGGGEDAAEMAAEMLNF